MVYIRHLTNFFHFKLIDNVFCQSERRILFWEKFHSKIHVGEPKKKYISENIELYILLKLNLSHTM